MKAKYSIPHYILASKTTRVYHFFIDIFFINVVFKTIYYFSDLVSYNAVYPRFSDWIDSLDQYEKIIYRAAICFFYYGLTEMFLSRTLAKYFTKTIVVLQDGSKPKFMDILARTSLRIMPFECLSFLRGRNPGFHDEYSKTFVVKNDKLENSKTAFFELQGS